MFEFLRQPTPEGTVAAVLIFFGLCVLTGVLVAGLTELWRKANTARTSREERREKRERELAREERELLKQIEQENAVETAWHSKGALRWCVQMRRAYVIPGSSYTHQATVMRWQDEGRYETYDEAKAAAKERAAEYPRNEFRVIETT